MNNERITMSATAATINSKSHLPQSRFNVGDKIKDGNNIYTIAEVSKGSWFFNTPTVYGIVAEDGTDWACEEKMLKNAVKIG